MGKTLHLKSVGCAILLLALAGLATAEEMKLDPGLLGELKARPLGPAAMSGRITAIDCVRRDSRILYVGTAGGGVWKSLDGGTIFKPVFGEYPQSIGCLTIDPSQPDTVWVGTGETSVRNSVSVGGGLYRSRDGGKSWELAGFHDSERIAKVIVHPQDSKTIYVGVLGHLWDAHAERGVYKSSDDGKTWQRLLFVDENTGCADLDIDPLQPDVLYAAMWQFRRQPYFFNSGGPGSGLFRSRDGGKTWQKLAKDLPAGNLGRIAVELAPSRTATLYATVEAKESGLYRSDDMGENWAKVNTSLAVRMRPFYFSSLKIHPRDLNTLLVAGVFFSVSHNGGQSFAISLLDSVGVHSDIHPIWIDPADPERVLLGTDGGVYISENGARSFRFLGNLPVSQFYHVAYDMQSPYWVYGGLQDNGSWCGPSRSFSTFGIQNKEWQNIGSGDGFYAFPHPRDNDILYYSWQGGRLQRYNRRSRETKDIRPLPGPGEPRYRFNWNAAVASSPSDPEVLYIGAQFLFRSRDRGDSWEKISPDLTSNDPQKQKQAQSGGLTVDDTSAENHCTIVTVAESPRDPAVIWAGTDDGNLQVSRDGGKNWQNVVANIPGLPPHTWCSGVEASRFDAAEAFAVFDGHRSGDMKPHVFRTGDFGRHWQPLAGETLKGYCHVIRQDLLNPALLFLGSEFGLFVSLDGGRQWLHLKKALPEVAVTDLAIHPREHDLIIATHGLGIQVIDDLTPLRALTPALLGAEAAVLPSRPALISLPTYFQEFPGDAEFRGENPPGGAVISYYLKKRHIFGDLKLEILDSSGRLLKALPSSKNAGINRVYWNMRLKPPKVGSSGGLGPILSEGPMVAEGTYTVRLSRGQQVFQGEIKLLNDPLTPHTAEERQLRHQTVMRIYALLEDVAYMVDSLAEFKKGIATVEQERAKAGPQSLLAELKRVAAALENFRRRLVQTEGIFGEEKVRERLMDLYTAVSGFGGKPTASQTYYVSLLETEVRSAQADFRVILDKELAATNAALKANKLKTLTIPSRQEYDQKER